MRKIILDTDIGSDIDDCFALAYLLSRKDVEVLGITTVSGVPEMRAKLADKICSSYGRSVPVCVGCEESLSGEVRQPRLTKAQTSVALSNEKTFSKENTAIRFMKAAIEENLGEITLVCIGQLTNAATLFSEYPHIPELLGGMVIMGGRYAENESCDIERWGKTEWNILCDIKAARIVFDKRVKNCTVIGVEQTCRFSRPPALIKNAFEKSRDGKVVADCINTTVDEVYFHDALAVYSCLFPDEVTFKRGRIKVEVCGGTGNAKTVFEPSNGGGCSLVTDFLPEKFFENYKDTVGIEV